MNVLVGCECSGIARDAFIARGHEAMSADFEPTERPRPHYRGDVRDVLDYPWDLAIMHPPCTNTSTSGARWFAEKRLDGRQQAGVAFFMGLWRGLDHVPKTVFEHPVSVISTLWRQPDQIIQPWQFWDGEPGRGEVKTTCLWLKGLRRLIPTTPEETGRHQACWLMGPSETRAADRARTYTGIAAAMADQWGAP
jgi:hypothetical protein